MLAGTSLRSRYPHDIYVTGQSTTRRQLVKSKRVGQLIFNLLKDQYCFEKSELDGDRNATKLNPDPTN